MMNDNSTIATEETDMMSFVDVGEVLKDGSLSMRVLPKHNVICVGSTMTTTQICVNIKARELPDDTRAPVDIIVALDVSGSMAGRKLDLCKLTLEQLLCMLLPKDRFGLVSYDTDARIELAPQKMTGANKAKALRIIKALTHRSMTNISAAIGLATQEMNAIEEPNAVRSIFLLTDGHPNQGVSDTAGLVEITKNSISNTHFEADLDIGAEKKTHRFSFFHGAQNKAGPGTDKVPMEVSPKSMRHPITMNCFGYGSDHNGTLLSELATAASGSYYFVENDSSVGTAFGDALGGVLSVVGQNVVVNIKVAPEGAPLGAEIVSVLHKGALMRENGAYSVTVGDFFAEETRDVLFEVKLASPTTVSLAPVPHAIVSMAYTDTILKRPVQVSPKICNIVRADGTEVSEANIHVVAQWIRVYASREIENAETQASRNDLEGARATILKIRAMIFEQDANIQSHELVKMIVKDLDEVEKGLVSTQTYANFGSKEMCSRKMGYRTQRCAEAEPGRQERNLYRSSAQARMANMMQIKHP
mmetsp:Transcript_23947/g.44025  ORF Transcript_23947/g.44025 Transcript_23947/m.44025 type:complete len:531 (+) Transcript_23947:131-1723(+)